jgi:hypothetical protein
MVCLSTREPGEEKEEVRSRFGVLGRRCPSISASSLLSIRRCGVARLVPATAKRLFPIRCAVGRALPAHALDDRPTSRPRHIKRVGARITLIHSDQYYDATHLPSPYGSGRVRVSVLPTSSLRYAGLITADWSEFRVRRRCARNRITFRRFPFGHPPCPERLSGPPSDPSTLPPFLPYLPSGISCNAWHLQNAKAPHSFGSLPVAPPPGWPNSTGSAQWCTRSACCGGCTSAA